MSNFARRLSVVVVLGSVMAVSGCFFHGRHGHHASYRAPSHHTAVRVTHGH